MKKHGLVIILILIFACFVRIIFISEVPPGIANDELNIILNAQSLIKTGSNIPGVVTGIFGTPTGDLSGGIHSEISSYLLTPFFLVFGFAWPFVKLPFVMASIGVVYLGYLLTRKLIGKEAGIITAALLSVNPWLIFFARPGYESIFSTFFYFLALYLIIILKGRRILWAFPVFILGFFCYFSAKTLILPLGLISIMAVKFFKPGESLKPVLLLNVLIIIFLLIYTPLLLRVPAGVRAGELKNQDVKSIVNLKRTISLNLPFTNLFENKFIEDLTVRIKASLGGLSPTYLFLDGQPENIPSLSIPDHGFLYLIDLPLIILGLIFLSRTNLKLLIFILSLCTITLIPNFLNLAGTTYAIRTVILFPILSILSAIGIYYIKKYHKKLLAIVIVLYLLFVGNFAYQYFGRLPIDKNGGWFLHQRVLTKYIVLAQSENPNTRIIITTNEPKQTFYRYIFFSGIYTNSKNMSEINNNLANKNYILPNLEFSNKCPDLKKDDSIYIIDTLTKCAAPQGNTISSPKDDGDKYVIVNDKLCNALVNKRYPLIKNFNLLDIESLTKQTLCQNYITNSARF